MKLFAIANKTWITETPQALQIQ